MNDFAYQHPWVLFLTGSTFIGLVAHAVTTFPTPKNLYGQWFLGLIKWLVGQRISAANAFNGYQTEVTAVTKTQKDALANGSTMQVVKTPEGVLKPVSEGKIGE